MAGDAAIAAAARVSGMLAARVDEAGKEAKAVALTAAKVAAETSKKAELADIAGDEAVAAGLKAITDSVTRGAREAAETAMGAAQRATSRAEEAGRASREATGRAEEIALAAKKAAEEALAKAEEALIKSIIKRLSSGTWIAVLALIALGTIFAAVMLSALLVGIR